MKKIVKIFGIIAFVALIGFSIDSCEIVDESGPDNGNNTNPALTGSVSISGNPVVGQTLSANTSSLDGTGTITYQWKRGSTNIGSNSSTYVVKTADVGGTITVTVTRAGYSGSKTSAATVVVTDDSDKPQLTGVVRISGTAEVGKTLTADTSDLGGTGTMSYAWRHQGGYYIGTDSSTYTVNNTDVGKKILLSVSRSGNKGYIESEPTDTVTGEEEEEDPPDTPPPVVYDKLEFKIVRSECTADVFKFHVLNHIPGATYIVKRTWPEETTSSSSQVSVYRTGTSELSPNSMAGWSVIACLGEEFISSEEIVCMLKLATTDRNLNIALSWQKFLDDGLGTLKIISPSAYAPHQSLHSEMLTWTLEDNTQGTAFLAHFSGSNLNAAARTVLDNHDSILAYKKSQSGNQSIFSLAYAGILWFNQITDSYNDAKLNNIYGAFIKSWAPAVKEVL